ncbi:hypothetical protein ES703_66037 [subsurface metagenome]
MFYIDVEINPTRGRGPCGFYGGGIIGVVGQCRAAGTFDMCDDKFENVRIRRLYESIVNKAIAFICGRLPCYRCDSDAAVVFGLAVGTVFDVLFDHFIHCFFDFGYRLAPLGYEQKRRLIGIFSFGHRRVRHYSNGHSALRQRICFSNYPDKFVIQLADFFAPFGFKVIDEGRHRRVLVEFVKVSFFEPRSESIEIVDISQQDCFRRKKLGCFGQRFGTDRNR